VNVLVNNAAGGGAGAVGGVDEADPEAVHRVIEVNITYIFATNPKSVPLATEHAEAVLAELRHAAEHGPPAGAS